MILTQARRRPLITLAVFAGVLFAGMYLFTALPRIFYPYDLDFIEDSMLIQSLRWAQGRPVYIAPSAEFVPHVYMPLYSWLGGWLLKAFGVSFAPLRLLSFAATLTTAGVIAYIGWRESGERWLAGVCAGLYLGGYRLTGFWYELARVDALFVALAMIGLASGLYAETERFPKTRRVIGAAVALVLAFFTKQTGLAFGAGVAAYWLLTAGRRAWLFIGLLAGVIGGGVWALNSVTDGWFLYHTFFVAGADPVEIERIFRYIGFELFGWMAGLSIMAAAAAVSGWRRFGVRILWTQPWLLAIGAAAVVSGAGRASVGGNVNNLMPVYALLCLSPALLWKELASARAHPRRFAAGEWVIVIGVLIQFGLGVYNPLRYIPTLAMRESGDRLIAKIESFEGPTLVMMHPYYAWLAGKEPSAQIAEIWYLLEWNETPLPGDFVDRIRNHYYVAILSSESLFETDPRIRGLIEEYYRRAETIDGPPTLTGMVVKPGVVLLPK